MGIFMDFMGFYGIFKEYLGFFGFFGGILRGFFAIFMEKCTGFLGVINPSQTSLRNFLVLLHRYHC